MEPTIRIMLVFEERMATGDASVDGKFARYRCQRSLYPKPDKPEPKHWNREGAKDAKEILNSWYLAKESLTLLRDLRALAVNFLSLLRIL